MWPNSNVDFNAETCALTTKCIKFQKDAISLREGGIGQFLISLATHGLVYITLLLVNDLRVLHVLWYKVTCVGVRDMFRFDHLFVTVFICFAH